MAGARPTPTAGSEKEKKATPAQVALPASFSVKRIICFLSIRLTRALASGGSVCRLDSVGGCRGVNPGLNERLHARLLSSTPRAQRTSLYSLHPPLLSLLGN